MRARARSINDLPEKPGSLAAYEMIPEQMRPYIVDGGLMEQPHLWLLEYEVVDQIVKREQMIDEANRRAKERSNGN